MTTPPRRDVGSTCTAWIPPPWSWPIERAQIATGIRTAVQTAAATKGQ